MGKLRSLLDRMRRGAVFFLDLLNRKNSPSEVRELGEFLLDGLQPLVPLAVSDLRLGFVAALTPVPVVQFLKVRDLGTESRNLFAKHCQVIHNN